MTLPLLGRMTTSSTPSASTASSSWAALGFMDWPPSTMAWQPSVAEELLVALAGDDGDDDGAALADLRPRAAEPLVARLASARACR